MRIPTQRRSSFDNESMTPMIDVVFLLLVFFVCASVGQKPDLLLPADLSNGTSENEAILPPPDPNQIKPQEVRIDLDQDTSGRLKIALNNGPLSGAMELKKRLQTLSDVDPRTIIILDASDDVSNQQWIAVYDLCQSLAFESISFAVRAGPK